MKAASCVLHVLLSIPVSLLMVGASSGQQPAEPAPAVPAEPITAILEAFRSHDIVALGEGAHGNEQGHAFRLSLIRDPRFAAAVNDIVVEFGNARYQDVMDRFVRGENVSDEALREVWQNTTQVTAVWDRPIYEEFFRAVRMVNATLPAERRLRVLLGDPPIDWENVQTFEALNKWMGDGNRDRHPVEVIQREVLAKQRRALVIYGEAHLLRLGRSIVQLLESGPTVKVFTIASPFSMPMSTDPKTLQADAGSWRVPGLVMLRGTVLGAAAVTSYFPAPPMMREGKPAAAGQEQRRGPRLEDQFDAILYLGDPSTITMNRLLPERCADARLTWRCDCDVSPSSRRRFQPCKRIGSRRNVPYRRRGNADVMFDSVAGQPPGRLRSILQKLPTPQQAGAALRFVVIGWSKFDSNPRHMWVKIPCPAAPSLNE